jgi:hypothetical protein
MIPASARLPAPGQLGPDPEPLSVERGARILERVEKALASSPDPAPRACPLERALGRTARCRGRACVYYRVPGVGGACAVMKWTGRRTPNRPLADWFIARRREAGDLPSAQSASSGDKPKEKDR